MIVIERIEKCYDRIEMNGYHLVSFIRFFNRLRLFYKYVRAVHKETEL